MAITKGTAAAASTAGSGTATTATTPSFTVSGTDKGLVAICVNRGNQAVSTVTANAGAISFTQIPGAVLDISGVDVEMWLAIAPTDGTYTATVTWASGCRGGITVIPLNGLHQTVPYGTPAVANGASTAVSVAVSSASGELVIDGFLCAGDPTATTATVDGSQDESSNYAVANGALSNGGVGGSSSEAGDTSVTMSWTLSPSRTWGTVGVPFKPAGAGGLSIPIAMNYYQQQARQ